HLNAYDRRKFQVDQLQERFAIFLEGCMKGNSLYNQLAFNYRVTEDGNFPFTAKIIYGNHINALPTKVTVVCKAKNAPVSVDEMAAAHLALFYEKPLQDPYHLSVPYLVAKMFPLRLLHYKFHQGYIKRTKSCSKLMEQRL
ncbi:centromere protein O, partial [Crotalus adamanteus]